MRQPVAPADRLGHRVREREHRARERGAAVAGAAEQLGARLELLWSSDDARQPLGDQARAGERVLVGGGIVSLHVQRLGAVGERVHRRADGRLAPADRESARARRRSRWDARRRRRPASAARDRAPRSSVVHSAPAYVVGTETSGSPVAAETALPRSIALPPPTASMPSAAARGGHGLGDAIRRHLAPDGDAARRAARGRPSAGSRRAAATRPRPPRRLRPASRAPSGRSRRAARARTSTNACATRVSARPLARTSGTSRAGSSPSTRTTASVPAARSASIAMREMNVTPKPPSTARARRLLQPELEPHVEVAEADAELAQLLLDHLPDAGALLHQDERLGLQLLERHALAGARARRGTASTTSSRIERLEHDAAVAARRRRRSPSSSSRRADLLDDVLRVRHRSARRAPRMQLLELAEDDGQDACRPARSTRRSRAGPRARPRPPRRAPRAAAPRARAAAARRGRAGGRPRSARRGGRSGRGAAGRALLERADLEADRGLRHAELLGRLREAPALDDGAEGGELLRVHKNTL